MTKHRREDEPTQLSRPRAATLRTVAAAIVGALPLIPEIVRVYGWESVPWIASVAAIAAATTRVLALPAVEQYLSEYVPWLAAGGKADKDQHDYH